MLQMFFNLLDAIRALYDKILETVQSMSINSLETFQVVVMGVLTMVGPFFVALMPATFTTYAIFHGFKDEAGTEMALFIALTVGFGLETVGIVAIHAAIALHNAKEQGIVKSTGFTLMAWLVPIYVACVTSIVYFSEDAFTPLVKSLGIASPFLTCIVYIAVSLLRNLKWTETKLNKIEDRRSEIETNIETEERTQKHKKELIELDQKHIEKMARIEATSVNQGVNQEGQGVNQSVNQSVKHVDFDTVNLSKKEKRILLLDKLIDIYLDNPEVGVSTIARSLDVTRQTVYNYQKELEKANRLRKNGDGWEVM